RRRGRSCRRRISRRRARSRCDCRAARRTATFRPPRSNRPLSDTARRAAAPSAWASEAADLLARQRAADAAVHAALRELLGGAVERVDRLLDGAVVGPGQQTL